MDEKMSVEALVKVLESYSDEEKKAFFKALGVDLAVLSALTNMNPFILIGKAGGKVTFLHNAMNEPERLLGMVETIKSKLLTLTNL